MTAPAHPAATICLLRDGSDGVEVLMVRRPDTARFMAGAWVFPGGAVDGEDVALAARYGRGDPERLAWRIAALRELAEEVGIWLTRSGDRTRRVPARHVREIIARESLDFDTDRLIYFSHWITPEPLPLRFDARFFLAAVGPDLEAAIDGEELIDAKWIRPASVLEHQREGRWLVAFPTRKTLERLSEHRRCAEVIDSVAGSSVEPIMPRLRLDGRDLQIVIPGDPGFDEAGADQRSTDFLERMADAVRRRGVVPNEFNIR